MHHTTNGAHTHKHSTIYPIPDGYKKIIQGILSPSKMHASGQSLGLSTPTKKAPASDQAQTTPVPLFYGHLHYPTLGGNHGPSLGGSKPAERKPLSLVPAAADPFSLPNAISGTMVVLKKGWIYKRGDHFFSQWHPKWAILCQEFPPQATLYQSSIHIHELLKPQGAIGRIAPSDALVPRAAGPVPTSGYQKAVMHLYDERSHADAKFPPKHAIILYDHDMVDLAPLSKDKRRFAWTIQAGDKKYELSTFSVPERNEWVAYLNKVKRLGWFLEHMDDGAGAADRKRMSEPSAPSKDEVESPSYGIGHAHGVRRGDVKELVRGRA